ncbi:iron chelate uptake ABC transporter family permease subunit, partial [Halomonas sp. BC2]
MPLRRWTPLGLLALMAVAALLFSLTVGSASLSMAQLWGVVQGQGDTLARTLVVELRLPRALSAF